MEHTFLTPWQNFGLIGIMVGVIAGLLFIIVKWTLMTTKGILEQSSKERESWIRALSEHTQQAKEFHNQVTTANQYARSEHEKMINNLNEQAIILGRINGYLHKD